MNISEKLATFADLATTCYLRDDEVPYFDPSDPENMKMALDFFHEELGFLSGRDKEDLLSVWQRACDDCRDTKLLFNAVRVLQDKYNGKP